MLTAFDRGIQISLNGDSDLTINNNTISSVLTIVNHGIDVATASGDASVRITDNEVTSILGGFGDGIHYIGNSTGEMTTVITGNTVRNLAGAFEDGIDVTYNAGSATTTIQGNVVANVDLVNLADVTGNFTNTALVFFSGAGARTDIVDLPALSLNNFGGVVHDICAWP